jgi:hypothetical protein
MNRIVSTIFAALAMLSAARADQFRIRETRTGNTYDVAYAAVRIVHGTSALETRTDKLGRLTVSLPPGQYEAEVIRGESKARVRLVIDGQPNLKVVVLR